jgi:hypothetical protein
MNIQTFLSNILFFFNDTLIPFLIGIAFLMFVWNAARYFVIEGSSEEGQQKAKSLALWGISAFVIIVSFWGVVNLLSYGFGFDDTDAIVPDYMAGKQKNGSVFPQTLVEPITNFLNSGFKSDLQNTPQNTTDVTGTSEAVSNSITPDFQSTPSK